VALENIKLRLRKIKKRTVDEEMVLDITMQALSDKKEGKK
jgi:hypothetical protein